MEYENRRSGFDSLAVVILLVLLLAVLVLGAGGFFFYARQQQMRAVAAAMRAEAQAQQAAEEAEKQRMLAEAARKEADSERADSAESEPFPITIAIDATGSISVDGERVEMDRLRDRLENDSAEEFVVEVDNDCRFEHLANVLAAFDELGRKRPRIATTR